MKINAYCCMHLHLGMICYPQALLDIAHPGTILTLPLPSPSHQVLSEARGGDRSLPQGAQAVATEEKCY